MIVEGQNIKVNEVGKIILRGPSCPVEGVLQNRFCLKTISFFNQKKFQSSNICYSQAFPGIIISCPCLVNNKEFKTHLCENSAEAIGGEMEGFVLMDIVNHQPAERQKIGAIIIKGVCDYADGLKRDDWHPTAALAAVEYAHTRLIDSAGMMKFYNSRKGE